MRTTSLTIVLAVLVTSTAGRAEPPTLDLHVGAGLPAGGIGLGSRWGRVEVLGEVELMGAAFVLMMSGGVHVNVDVVQRPRWGLYTGAFAAGMHVVAGSDEVFEESYRGLGAVGGVRIHHRSGSMSHAIEAGVFYARCTFDRCNDGPSFLSIDLAYRLQFHLL